MDSERLKKLSEEGDGEASLLLGRLELRRGTGKLSVTYDGRWPAACAGTLTITRGDCTLYSENNCCNSSGSVNWMEEDVEDGVLTWDEEDKFPEWVREEVRKVLEEVRVCCGGCI